MNKKLIAICLIMLMSVNMLPAFAADSAILEVVMADQDSLVGIGREVTVNIVCDNNSLNTFDLQLEFDPAYLKVVKDPSTPYTDGVTAVNTYDNTNGTIRFMHSFAGGAPDRNGVIASITFEALAEGETGVIIGEGTKLLKLGTVQGSPDIAYNSLNLALPIYTIEAIRPQTPYVHSPTGSNTKFYNSLRVDIRTKTEDASIYYTLDGTDPVIGEGTTKLLNGALTIYKTTTINAVAYKNNLYSDTLSIKYTLMSTPQNGNPSPSTSTPVYTPVITPTPTPTPTPAAPQGPTFNDVAGHWAEENIYKLANEQVINGYEDGSFRPDAFITRAEAAKIIIIAAGLQPAEGELPFADSQDVPGWAAGYVKTAYDQGIITGYEDGTFLPNKQLTREEMVTILARALKLGQGDTALLDTFTDKDTIQGWAAPSVAKAVELGLVGGYEDGTFLPGNNITRAEVCKIIAGCMG